MRLLLLALFACASLQAAVVHVDADATGTSNGSSWANACTTLQAGLALAASGDQVWISQGTYKPGTVRSSTFTIPDGVAVYGGFLGSETTLDQRLDDPRLCVLSGELGAAGYADNVRRLVTMPGSGRLDTLTVTMANYDGASLDDAAGLLATGSGADIALVRCRFHANRAYGPQLILIRNAAQALIERSEITDTAELSFRQKSVGTIWFDQCTSATMSQTVVDSVAPASVQDFSITLSFSGCASALAENCVFVNCRCITTVSGGTIQGGVFAGNRVYNTLWVAAIRGCIIEPSSLGNLLDGVEISENNWFTNSNGDPRFANRAAPAGADGIWFTADDGLRLQASSPCIGQARFATATTTQGMPRVDLLGTPRPQGGFPDCGAYEHPTGNAGPVADQMSIQAHEDALTPIVLAGSDADGDALSAVVLSLPAAGVLLPTDDGVTASGPALSSTPYQVDNPGRIVLFRPAGDVFGNAYASFTFAVDDGQDASEPATASIDVLSVNDAPGIDQPAAQVVLEDSGQRLMALTGITAGTPGLANGDPSCEIQVLAISATSSDPLLVANPTISYISPSGTATLAFAPVANANGTATITVTVRDDGGTANDGSDTTLTTFTVTVLPVNDPPQMAAIANLTLPEDCSDPDLTTVSFGGIAAGPADEAGQTLSISAVSSDTGVIRIGSVDHASGSTTARLQLILPPEANGSALIFISLFDDGGTTNGGGDATARVCRVTVTPVDDPPVLVANPGLTAASNHVTAIAAAQLRIADPDATPPGSLVFSLASTPAHGAIRRAGTVLLAGGTFSQADIDDGLLTYANAGGISASDTWSFTWTDGTTAVQGPATMAITLGGSELPVLAIPGAGVAWTEGPSPAAVAASALVSDPDAVPWDGGSVTATITAGAATGDILGLAEQGVGLGQVSVLGASVRVGGTAVGTLSGGSGGVPLHIALSGAEASPAIAQAIVRALTFANQGGDPGAAPRSIVVVVNDGGAGASAPAMVAVTVTPVNDAPAVATTWIGLPAGATILAQLAADDPDGPAATWTLLSAPGLADVTLEDASAGILRIIAHPGAAGSGTLRVRVDDGLAAAVEADIALVVSGGGDARPEPAGELPPDSHAGGEIDAILRFDTAGIGGTSGLLFSASADAPAGLQLSSAGADRVRVRWSIPAAMPAPSYVRFAIIASDPASRSSGILPVLLLVRPQPGGGG